MTNLKTTEMKAETELFNRCISLGFNVSLTYQRINDYSIEIYHGYQTSYKQYFYTDGNLTRMGAIRKAIRYLDKLKKEGNAPI